MNMSIAICFNNKDPEPWATALQAKLPKVNIEVYPDIKDYDKISFVLCWKADKDILSSFSNLKVVQSVGASIDHVLNHQTLKEDVVLCRMVDEKLSTDMFEYVLAGIMTHIKRFDEFAQFKKGELWHPIPYKTIDEVSIGILGLGKIGAYVASKLAGLGFTVKGWSRSQKDIAKVECFHGSNGLQRTLQSTDILINILPFTKQTEDILNAENLSRLNQDAYLINVGRGEHLVETDLLDLLERKHLSGALLDVFRTEPLPKDHPFWHHEKIKISPHIAAITNVASALELVVKNYQNFQKGIELLNVVDVGNGY